jgi:hypothetical protein
MPLGIETLTELGTPRLPLEAEKIGAPVASWYIPALAKPIPAPIASTIRIGTRNSIYFIFFGGVVSNLEHGD